MYYKLTSNEKGIAVPNYNQIISPLFKTNYFM